MKTAEANFNFPVLGFTPDRQIWGFPDRNALTACGSFALKENMQAEMELVDSDGRRWVVRSIRKVGRARSLLKQALLSLLMAGPLWRIEYELDELEAVSLSDIRERTCLAIETFADNYCHFTAEEDWDEHVAPLLAKMRSAESVAEIYTELNPDSFEGY